MEFLKAFPIAIIDEDYEGKHAAGRGMRQLAEAIEKGGFIGSSPASATPMHNGWSKCSTASRAGSCPSTVRKRAPHSGRSWKRC